MPTFPTPSSLGLAAGLVTAAVSLVLSPKAHAEGIDLRQCSDPAAAATSLAKEIKNEIRQAANKGYRPALGYENGEPSLETRATQQSSVIVNSLMAALRNPQNPADAASKRIFDDPSRRASMTIYGRCSSSPSDAMVLVQNAQSVDKCSSGSLKDVAMNSRQVFETSLPAADVMERFARFKLTSTKNNSVRVCAAGSEACSSAGGAYRQMDAANWKPDLNREYFIEDSTDMVMSPMVNRSVLKVRAIDFCGATAYLVTGFGNGHRNGFDRSSLVGLVAPFPGNKTLVLGDMSAMGQGSSWPMYFPSYPSKAAEVILGKVDRSTGRASGGYHDLARLIGSDEVPSLGRLPQARQIASGSDRVDTGETESIATSQ